MITPPLKVRKSTKQSLHTSPLTHQIDSTLKSPVFLLTIENQSFQSICIISETKSTHRFISSPLDKISMSSVENECIETFSTVVGREELAILFFLQMGRLVSTPPCISLQKLITTHFPSHKHTCIYISKKFTTIF